MRGNVAGITCSPLDTSDQSVVLFIAKGQPMQRSASYFIRHHNDKGYIDHGQTSTYKSREWLKLTKPVFFTKFTCHPKKLTR